IQQAKPDARDDHVFERERLTWTQVQQEVASMALSPMRTTISGTQTKVKEVAKEKGRRKGEGGREGEGADKEEDDSGGGYRLREDKGRNFYIEDDTDNDGFTSSSDQ
ncbi:hypothetical protein AMTR_s00104p00135460, partial [Amborella trichopoda]